ncbi:cellulose synthase/poly-beta-1,6-N-acetylglucosamine synthase-like glycosyltransferase [Dyadobacter jejuensis]|uniref:Cellulose synthase/poly-beta-1,6-N-acetylglucosamine synthase-like glycosyltransferase n=1 Tax=Dyadobacter jejuensis TaxID=1082580 RepID=A0A316ANE1_9BACT|nr:glycosyltransferase [Dyadobacter jejuensis]PWJ59066.1 cellulose synthase/poly-beta-1,6-N-acetylglucosamine synthase-like glycosyltransferase [Dyadobacter jejuensis]
MIHSALQVILVVIAITLVCYFIFTCLLAFTWKRQPAIAERKDLKEPSSFFTVIVPVRNEANNIGKLLQDLIRQDYPSHLYEVLIMNDGSTDATAQLVEEIIRNTTRQIHLVELPSDPSKSPKKRAIEHGIKMAKGSLITTTDGDCRMGPHWLSSIDSYYQSTACRLISGPVTFLEPQKLTDHLQIIEFASLVGSGACSLVAGFPSMCNGANLTYEKRTFMAVGGYSGVDHLASGDDEFLLHKIADQFPGQYGFINDPEVIVSTAAHQDWTSFYRQRKRWGSKWKHYTNPTPKILAIFIFMANVSMLISVVLALFGCISLSDLAIICLLKCLPEWIFLTPILGFLKKRSSIPYIPLTQLLYPFYVCLFGLAAQDKTYIWKGRRLS